jgi:hypothetical protein
MAGKSIWTWETPPWQDEEVVKSASTVSSVPVPTGGENDTRTRCEGD